MKQYRVKFAVRSDIDWLWTEWRNLDVPICVTGDLSILTIQFSDHLSLEEAKEFFKHYEVV